MDPAWIVAAISLVTLVVGMGTWVMRWAWRIGRRTWDFLDDYYGKPADQGRPAVPGVMERLGNLETGMSAIRHEVTLNSGKSMRDTVARIETNVDHIREQIGGQP